MRTDQPSARSRGRGVAAASARMRASAASRYRRRVTAEGALAFLIAAVWLGAVAALLAWVTRRLHRRTGGGRPLHLIPWYLGGEAERPLEAPPESSRARRRSGR